MLALLFLMSLRFTVCTNHFRLSSFICQETWFAILIFKWPVIVVMENLDIFTYL